MSQNGNTNCDPLRSNKIGESIYRIEDAALLRGRGTFIDDVDVGHGVVHVGFLRSQYAHARHPKRHNRCMHSSCR